MKKKLSFSKKSLDIVIPTYQSTKVLDIPLRSIINQKSHNFIIKVLLIDSNSRDGINEFIDHYKSLLDIQIYNVGPCSIGEARNFGVRKSTSEYIIFLDSDDALTKDRLLTDSAFIKKLNEKKIDFIFGNSIQIQNKIYKYSYETLVHENPKFLQYLHIPYNVGSLTINLKKYKKNNISFEDGRLGEDWQFTIDISNILTQSFYSKRPRIIINSRPDSHTQDEIQYKLTKNTFRFLNETFCKYNQNSILNFILNIASINSYLIVSINKFIMFSKSKSPLKFFNDFINPYFQKQSKYILISIFLLPITILLLLFFHRKSRFSIFKKGLSEKSFKYFLESVNRKI